MGEAALPHRPADRLREGVNARRHATRRARHSSGQADWTAAAASRLFETSGARRLPLTRSRPRKTRSLAHARAWPASLWPPRELLRKCTDFGLRTLTNVPSRPGAIW